MSAPLIDGVLYGPFQRPLKLRFLVATRRMSVFLDDAHSILRQPALICANGIGIPAFLNSEHSMVLYLRLYLAFRFFFQSQVLRAQYRGRQSAVLRF
ncbi:hypothetical protein EN41_11125 [Agrobacterium tumefaciens]|nr:hypothetical protein EN41_11125 [Agrobacterium tumefaciens]